MAPLFNDCFEQTSYTMDVAQYNFIGMMLTAAAYGIHTILFINCIKSVYRRGLPLLSYVIVVFTLATVEFALQIWWYETVVIKGKIRHDGHHIFIQLHHHHTISLARTTIYMIMNWFSEGILLYRFYVISHLIGGHALLFGLISFSVFSLLVVAGGICIPAVTGLGFAWLPNICAVPGIVYLCLSISAHVILTSLIVIRIALLRRKLQKYLGVDHCKIYFSLAVVLVESASLYTIWALTSLILYGMGSPGQFILLPAQGQIQAICPLLIINWVVSGRALSKDLNFATSLDVKSVQFSSDVLPRYPNSTYFSPTSSTSKVYPWTIDSSSSRITLQTFDTKRPLTDD